jgi:deoxyribonuclease-1
MIVCLYALFGSTSVYADQTVIRDYAYARERVFFRLYVSVPQYESTDIYCGLRFRVHASVAKLPPGAKTGKRPAIWLTLEHAYPADWMADALECGNRTECGKMESRFNRAEADLHNLWPALDRLNSSRGKRLFGEVGDPHKTAAREITIGRKTFRCNFENDGDVVEPRRIVRGNLARSIFYMCEEYGFPVDAQMLEVLKR